MQTNPLAVNTLLAGNPAVQSLRRADRWQGAELAFWQASTAHQSLEAPGKQAADNDQEQAVHAHVQTRQLELPTQKLRQLQRLLLRAKEVGGGRHGHEHQADRKQHLVEVCGTVQTAVQHPLEQHANRCRRQRGQGKRQQERNTQAVKQGDADITPHHGKRAMGQVDKVHQPQRDRQAHADEE